MKKFVFSVFVLIATTTASTLFAQVSSVKNNNDLNIINTFTGTEKADDNWAMYADEDNHKYYIDFQKINVNLNDIHVKNEAGKEIFKDVLYTLPVDTIYELDFSSYAKGTYDVELRTFTQTLKRKITIK